MNDKARGTVEMTTAMTISGTIGWFVVRSGQPVLDVVFWRCVFGALTLLAVCAALGLLRGAITWRRAGLAALPAGQGTRHRAHRASSPPA